MVWILMKETLEQSVVERQKRVIMVRRLPKLRATMGKIVLISSEQTFFLKKIHKHEPIEQHKGISFSLLFVGNPLDKGQKEAILCFESLMEFSGGFIPLRCPSLLLLKGHDLLLFLFSQT